MKADFFKHNRKQLSERLSGGVVVLSAYGLMQRSNDASFGFEQEANFWYLTGIEEPNWWVIIDGTRQKSWLVAPKIDAVHRTFEGGLSDDEARKISAVDEVISHDDAMTVLREAAKKHSVVFTLGEHPYKEHFNFVENPAQKKTRALLERTFNAVQDCRKELSRLRAIKQPDEIVAMKKAIRLTVDTFQIVEQKMADVRFEYELEAEFDYQFKKLGATHAYDPIVASGKNACTLHYSKNNQKVKKNSLILMDVGARYHGYAADITRTYVSGLASARQATVHAALKQAHEHIIACLKPGLLMVDYQKHVDETMKQALGTLDLLSNADDEEAYRRYFPHAISHGLGIDVHDSLGGARELREGMVLTVEPGIYIPKESMGLRIEDDILITATGHTNLSARLSTELQ